MGKYNKLVISGGATRVLASIGVVKALDEAGIYNNIHTFAGTSAGAIVALTCSLGYNVEEMVKVFEENKENLTLKIHKDPLVIIKKWGLDDGTAITSLCKSIITRRGISENIKFEELSDEKNLVVAATNLTKGCVEYFCKERTPSMSVLQAVRMSCAIPIMYTPVSYNGDVYVDGGIYDNLPFSAIEHDANTLMINVSKPMTTQEIQGIHTYINRLVEVIGTRVTRTKELPENVDVIEVVVDMSTWKLSKGRLGFNLDKIEYIIENGYETAKRFIQTSG